MPQQHIDQRLVDAYCKYYSSQHGGAFPVYRGYRGDGFPVYRGDGIGDFFRGLMRRVFPIALKGASTFLSGMNQAREQGASWKDAAKGAISPTAGAVLSGAKKAFDDHEEEKRQKQAQSGGRRRRKHKKVYKHPLMKQFQRKIKKHKKRKNKHQKSFEEYNF